MEDRAPERLMVFTRYPRPGSAKTRLIPALGEDGAARLHRRMSEHAVRQARACARERGVNVEVHYAGSSPAAMASWLGGDLIYRAQADGDLGARMESALAAAFASGAARGIVMGTDCPALTAALLQRAFRALEEHGVVIGPALDGGYYLIGMRRIWPELFAGLAWGTADVLAQTLRAAQALDLDVATLPELADVDRPEDLAQVRHMLEEIGVREGDTNSGS